MSIDIDPLSDAAGLTVTDHIENTQFEEVYTDRPVEPAASPEDAHYFPVDASVTVETGAIEIPRVAVVETRCGDGTLLTRGDSYAMPGGTYHVGIDPAPTKLYLAFASPFSVSTTERTTRIDLDAPAEVTLGFRSVAPPSSRRDDRDPDRPRVADGRRVATRLRSPDDEPGAVVPHPSRAPTADRAGRGVPRPRPTEPNRSTPAFGSSSLRSTATSTRCGLARVLLRRRRGPRRSSPDRGGDGTHPLEPDFERRTGEVLRQAFHFDCLARTEGFYPVDLHERETTDLDLDWGRLYDLPLAERLGEYLAVPFERVEPELPQWTLTTDVRPDPENVELLPFVVAGELSIVRSPETV